MNRHAGGRLLAAISSNSVGVGDPASWTEHTARPPSSAALVSQSTAHDGVKAPAVPTDSAPPHPGQVPQQTPNAPLSASFNSAYVAAFAPSRSVVGMISVV